MTRHFSIPTVLRMTPNGLLRAIFTRLGHDMHEVVWDKLPQRKTQPILDAIQKLSQPDQNAMELALHNIFELACENGARAIREAAASAAAGGQKLYLPDVGGAYCMSACTWLQYPDVFDRAMLLFEVDHLGRWRKRKDVPRMTPRTSAEALSALGSAIGDILLRAEGRGQHCTVEHVRRGDGAECFLAYPDDFVHTILMHDAHGNLTPRCIRPAFEMAFAYSQAAGTLELNAKVPTRLKPELEDAFCQNIIGQKAECRGSEPIYNLNVLKDGPDRLETDPEDRVTPIVRRLRLAVPESQDLITLEPDRADGPNGVYRMLGEYINRDRLPLTDVDVASATISLVLHSTDVRKKGRLTFDIARPDTCTLRNHRADRVAVAQKYLKRWGIAVG